MKEREESVNPDTLSEAEDPAAIPEGFWDLLKDNADLLSKDTFTAEDQFRFDQLLKQAADKSFPFFNSAAPAGPPLPLTLMDFAELTDEELYEALQERTVDLADTGEPDELADLPQAIRLFTRANQFLIEFDDGGFAQVLCEPTARAFFNLLPEDLRELGAEEHRQLREAFMTENHIDSSVLAGLRPRNQSALRKKYDFDRFDERFADLPPLWLLLTAHARKNQADWIGFPREN